GRGEKQGTAGSSKDNNRVNVELGSNSATRIPNVVNACLESFRTVSKAHGIRYSTSANEENTNDAGTVNDVANNGTTVGPALAGNTPGNEVDVVVPVESIRAISERFANTAYGFFLGKRVTYPFVANYNPDVNLLKKDVGNILVWVKLYGVPATAFSEDGLSAIATKLDTPLMFDSYTSDMCIQSWGIENEVASVDNNMANFPASKKVGCGTNSLLEQWKETHENGDYNFNPYGDDMYEDQDIPDKIQDICDNLDIKIRGRKKK
nr:hypothetical protein [Tanacetum cinerariifolium]